MTMAGRAKRAGLRRRTILLWSLLAAALALLPLWLVRGAAFEGSDDLAVNAIHDIQPDYRPWFVPLWGPANAQTESFLFALQAALGAAVAGYAVGYLNGKKKAARPPKDGISPP